MLVDINLLPEKEKRRSALLMAALAILGAAVLFWVVLFILSNSLSKETVTLEQQVASLQESQEAIRSDIHLSESGGLEKTACFDSGLGGSLPVRYCSVIA